MKTLMPRQMAATLFAAGLAVPTLAAALPAQDRPPEERQDDRGNRSDHRPTPQPGQAPQAQPQGQPPGQGQGRYGGRGDGGPPVAPGSGGYRPQPGQCGYRPEGGPPVAPGSGGYRPQPGQPGYHPGGYGWGQGGYRPGAGDPGQYRGGGWTRQWRDDRRYDWRSYRTENRYAFNLPRYAAPAGWRYGYRRFSPGFTLSAVLFDQGYWIGDPFAYRLPPAQGPYRWVRYYNDALLVDIRTGYVVDTVYDIFW